MQFGFTAGLSAIHATTSLGSVCSRSLEKKQPVLAVALDIQKAYDAVEPVYLIDKLSNGGFDPHWTGIIFHLLQDRLFSVKIEDAVSRVFAAVIGLPQGSALAPILFKFFVQEIPQPRGNTRAYGFADDLLVIARGRPKTIQKNMQRYLL